jgi:hypothetical protein
MCFIVPVSVTSEEDHLSALPSSKNQMSPSMVDVNGDSIPEEKKAITTMSLLVSPQSLTECLSWFPLPPTSRMISTLGRGRGLPSSRSHRPACKSAHAMEVKCFMKHRLEAGDPSRIVFRESEATFHVSCDSALYLYTVCDA